MWCLPQNSASFSCGIDILARPIVYPYFFVHRFS
jgi:hypothetical protein